MPGVRGDTERKQFVTSLPCLLSRSSVELRGLFFLIGTEVKANEI